MANLKITLKRSLIGRLPAQIKTANSLGLRKIGDCTTQQDIPATTGKIKAISHLITVEKEG